MKNILLIILITILPAFLIAQKPILQDTVISLNAGDTEDDFANSIEMAGKIIIINQNDAEIPKEYTKKEKRFYYEVMPGMNNDNFKIISLPKEYTGFKIQLLKVEEEPLPDDDVIFFRHGNVVEEEVDEKNFAYLIGNFKTEVEAEQFMENFLEGLYTDAIIVEYKMGRRI